MASVNSLSCCGVREIVSLSVGREPPQTKMKQVVEQTIGFNRYAYYPQTPETKQHLISAFNLHCAHLIFTEAGTRSKYGREFAAFIRENELGEVMQTSGKVNPNSRRAVTAWVWSPDRAALKKWYLSLNEEKKETA